MLGSRDKVVVGGEIYIYYVLEHSGESEFNTYPSNYINTKYCSVLGKEIIN